MQKVSDYTLVVDKAPHLLVQAVKRHMDDGWVPSGTVVLFNGDLVQAMVKFSDA